MYDYSSATSRFDSLEGQLQSVNAKLVSLLAEIRDLRSEVASLKSERVASGKTDQPSKLSASEHDTLSVLYEVKRRIEHGKITDMLEGRGAVYGDSTIRNALAKLVRSGHIAAGTRHEPGYLITSTGESYIESKQD